jgi:hypothetical protein
MHGRAAFPCVLGSIDRTDASVRARHLRRCVIDEGDRRALVNSYGAVRA